MNISAKYNYYPPSPTSDDKPNASLAQLATNVVTDWMPGVPNSVASSFSDLLGEMLKPEAIDGEDLWIVGPQMTGFEKQWKQVSSWILGVAFCRKVIEDLGYRWWAPVSAFNSKHRTTFTRHWTAEIPATDCVVKKTNSSILFPDYVLARTKSDGSGFEVSFAESKGCTKSLTGLVHAPTDWKNQAQNGIFLFCKVPQPITQYLLIATRVYPLGQRPKTRRIQVRAWNAKDPDARVSFEALRDVMVAHYFGVCERIGLQANAQLLAIANFVPTTAAEQFLKRLSSREERLLGQARLELQAEQLGQTSIYTSGRRSLYRVAENTIRIGLSQPATNLIRALQSRDQRNNADVVKHFERDIVSTERLVNLSNRVFVRNDGVIGELLE